MDTGPSSRSRRLRLALLTAMLAATVVAGCRQLLVAPTPAATSLSVALEVPELIGADAASAFDKADRIYIRVDRPGSPPVEILEDFDPAGQVTTVSLTLNMNEEQEVATITLELRFGTSVLFTAAQEVVLIQGSTPAIEFDLSPTPAAVVISGDETLDFDALGTSFLLTAIVAFATGDEFPGAQIAWSSSDGRVASVDSRGTVTIRGNGNASIRAAYGNLSDAVQLHVQQAVATVTVTPGQSSIGLGETLQLNAVLRDSRNNPITGPAVSWSAVGSAATVHPTSGVVTGVAPGTATITASAEGKSGSAVVSVSRVSSASFDGEWSGLMHDVQQPGYTVGMAVVIAQNGSSASGTVWVDSGGFESDQPVLAASEGMKLENAIIHDNAIEFSAERSDGMQYYFLLALSEDGTRLVGGGSECIPDYYCYDYEVFLDRLGAEVGVRRSSTAVPAELDATHGPGTRAD